MKVVVLAAGYGTRLLPLSENTPKPLLEVGGKAVLDHLFDRLEGSTLLDNVCVVTNARYRDRPRGEAPDSHLRAPQPRGMHQSGR